MRFPNQAEIEDLHPLVAACDDRSGSHVFWIHHDGRVHVTRIAPGELAPDDYAQILRSGAVYLVETLPCGEGFVGPTAVTVSAWIKSLHSDLHEGWIRHLQGLAEGRFLACELESAPELLALLRSLEKL